MVNPGQVHHLERFTPWFAPCPLKGVLKVVLKVPFRGFRGSGFRGRQKWGMKESQEYIKLLI